MSEKSTSNSIFHYDFKKVYQLIFFDTWKKLIKKSKFTLHNFLYPVRIESLWIFMCMALIINFATPYGSFDIINNIIVAVVPDSSFLLTRKVSAACMSGFTYWIAYFVFMRVTLKLLLSYQGFLFESRNKKISLTTKLWGAALKIIIKLNPPRLYSFQNSLPRLPVPSLKSTLNLYLLSVRPLLDDSEFEKARRKTEDFEKGIGKKLQRYLILKSWWSSNYVSDWWEKYAYLRNRSPLITYSNIYGTDNLNHPTKKQSARSANLIHQTLIFRQKLIEQKIQPIMVQGIVPLCSWQCKRMFNTARVPGIENDEIIHSENGEHIVVLHKGCYYKMPFTHNGRLLNVHEIQYQLDHILKANSNSSHAEKYLASLTAWERSKWGETRQTFFTTGNNKVSLECIESSAFFFNLHDGPYDMDLDNSEKMKIYSKECLHGKIFDIWFDKSFCLASGTNARFTMNAEHSWADAPILGILFETILYNDLFGYDENENLKNSNEFDEKPVLPSRLKWDFSDEKLVKNIDEAYTEALKIVNDTDHYVYKHEAFGKGFIKTCRVSPDAFVQMALQLAYYREFNKFALTYEASMTRLFKEGRTETVRSCTIESCKWVLAMQNENSTTKDKIDLLKTACGKHQQSYLDAMTGKGIDRHLFSLYVVSKYLKIESPFLNEVLSEPWRLSTSQTPHGQIKETDFNKYPQLRGSGGGFGPVSFDGYSVSYIVSGESNIFFHISSTVKCTQTDSKRYADQIKNALLDIKALFEKFTNEQKLKNN